MRLPPRSPPCATCNGPTITAEGWVVCIRCNYKEPDRPPYRRHNAPTPPTTPPPSTGLRNRVNDDPQIREEAPTSGHNPPHPNTHTPAYSANHSASTRETWPKRTYRPKPGHPSRPGTQACGCGTAPTPTTPYTPNYPPPPQDPPPQGQTRALQPRPVQDQVGQVEKAPDRHLRGAHHQLPQGLCPHRTGDQAASQETLPGFPRTSRRPLAVRPPRRKVPHALQSRLDLR